MVAFGLVQTIIAFVLYIVLHAGIGYYKQELEKQNKEKPGNQDIEKQIKFMGILFKWFPAIYLIIIIVMFYM